MAENTTNQNTEQKNANHETSVFVTAGKFKDDKGVDKTIIGFGSQEAYKGNAVNAKNVFYSVGQINNFLKAVDASKIPITIKATDNEDKATYIKANAYYHTGVSKDGKAYGFNKIAFELQPEKKNKAGEITQEAQKIYATKGKQGYAFDKNSNQTLLDKFTKAIEKSAEFSLASTNNKTLERYPQLMSVVKDIDKSAKVNLGFVKTQGVVIKSIDPIEKGGKTGSAKIISQATKKTQKKDIDR